MHRQRVLTTLVLLPLVISGLIWGGETFFAALILVVSFFCLLEYFQMAFPKEIFHTACGTLLGLLIPSFAIYFRQETYVLFGVFLVIFFSCLYTIFTYSSHKNPFNTLCRLSFGGLYVGLCTGLIALIRYVPHGREWIFFLLIVVFCADTGAYYMGKGFGRRKLCPSISKGKTVEGAMGGLFLSGLGGIFSWAIFFNFFDLRLLLPLAVLLGLVSQAGDLVESVVKRTFGFKDSGRLLPGHGGVFDRVDGLLLAGPVLFWTIYFSEGNFFLG